MARQSPLISIEKAILGMGGWFFYKMGQFTSSAEDTIEKTGFFRFLYDSSIGIVQTLVKLPQLILSNIQVFIYILCILIAIGQFDWILNDLYALVAMAAVLTYVTYR